MTTLAELSAHLQHELGICRRLLLILKLTRQTLTKSDPAQLETCIAQQATLAEDLHAAEGQRLLMVGELATAAGLRADSTLLELAATLPASDGAAFIALTRDLGAVIADIHQVQAVNQTLLQHALDYVDLNMEMVAGLERQTEVPTTYAPPAFAASAASAYRDVPASSVVNYNA